MKNLLVLGLVLLATLGLFGSSSTPFAEGKGFNGQKKILENGQPLNEMTVCHGVDLKAMVVIMREDAYGKLAGVECGPCLHGSQNERGLAMCSFGKYECLCSKSQH